MFKNLIDFATRKIVGKIGKSLSQEGLTIGYGENVLTFEKQLVSIPWNIANRHVYIIGATGSGKTVLLRNLAYQAVRAGYGLLYIDMKGGQGTMEAFRDIWLACNETGRQDDFVYISPVEAQIPCKTGTWSPLISGDGATVTNKIYETLQVSSPNAQFYEDVKFDVLQRLIFAAKSTNKIFTFGTLAKALSSRGNLLKFGIYANENEREAIFELAEEWKTNPSQFSKNIKGTAVTLQRLSVGLPAKILETTSPTVDFADAVEKRQVLFCLLPTLVARKSMRHIAKLLLAEIKYICGEILNFFEKKTKFFIIIDEFEEMVFPAIKDMFNKAREAGINMIIAHQTISDINYEIGDDFAKSLVDNTATKIIMQVKSHESAEYFSDIIGKYAPIPIVKKWFNPTHIVTPGILAGKNAFYENGLGVGEAIAKIDANIFRVRIPFPKRRNAVVLGKDLPYPSNNRPSKYYGKPLLF